MELGGRTSPYGVESVIVVAIAGAVLSGILGATVGSWLGGLCERRPGLLGPTANMLGGIATAIGAAAYTAIAAGLLFDSEPFNASSWPRAWIAACGAYGFVLGYVGGVISARRIAAYARWREEVSRRYGNAPA
jgi:hypothetical protein